MVNVRFAPISDAGDDSDQFANRLTTKNPAADRGGVLEALTSNVRVRPDTYAGHTRVEVRECIEAREPLSGQFA
jgi:hypothetical protein